MMMMKMIMQMLLLSFLLLLSTTTTATTTATQIIIKGASTHASLKESEMLTNAYATHQRIYVHWKYIEPSLSSIPNNLTVDYIRTHPDVIDEWARSVNWNEVDKRVQNAVSCKLIPIIEVGEGTIQSLPVVYDNKTIVDPNNINPEVYIALQYRYTRAVIRRYRNITNMYQVENELNEAWLAGFAGQRVRNIDGGPWRNTTFLTQLLSTLIAGIKTEQPTAIVTTNLHTDVPKSLHMNYSIPGYYVDAAKLWYKLVDILSIDAYPNMYVAYPLLTTRIGERILNIKNVTNDSIDVFVMETGYPVSNVSNPPNVFAYTAERQSQYITQTYNEIVRVGGVGLMYFDMAHDIGMQAPSDGGYNALDIQAFILLTNLIITNGTRNVTYDIEWALEHLSYMETRFTWIAGQVSNGWGLLDESYNPRPAYHTLANIFKNSS